MSFIPCAFGYLLTLLCFWDKTGWVFVHLEVLGVFSSLATSYGTYLSRGKTHRQYLVAKAEQVVSEIPLQGILSLGSVNGSSARLAPRAVG
ncbi:hypothetical protein F5X97DRAFT_314638 [Nemania serpens]|nr:hypothetical protein F5X97DRAFT_314638 [Nemania serpens]